MPVASSRHAAVLAIITTGRQAGEQGVFQCSVGIALVLVGRLGQKGAQLLPRSVLGDSKSIARFLKEAARHAEHLFGVAV
ncbi:hypothetical protein [Pseudomonas qingdaonensis]|uniref:hypothetical protein n=1 Tax=Pseudomonas qingdaonensis TaxID=2056231 RepID=UPI00242DCAA8|nr:hypothetical protein [Pseudomonas qingdaonensis]